MIATEQRVGLISCHGSDTIMRPLKPQNFILIKHCTVQLRNKYFPKQSQTYSDELDDIICK